MKIEETYNIHKKINCILPYFKSKHLCKKGLHNYAIENEYIVMPNYYTEEDDTHTETVIRVTGYQHYNRTYLKCLCCGQEVELDE